MQCDSAIYRFLQQSITLYKRMKEMIISFIFAIDFDDDDKLQRIMYLCVSDSYKVCSDFTHRGKQAYVLFHKAILSMEWDAFETSNNCRQLRQCHNKTTQLTIYLTECLILPPHCFQRDRKHYKSYPCKSIRLGTTTYSNFCIIYERSFANQPDPSNTK